MKNPLWLLPPESAHCAALGLLKEAQRCELSPLLWRRPPAAPCRVFGLDFPNPVGLAAGLDKSGDYIDALARLGFGFLEVGTVTPRPQPGNPRPRLLRLSSQRALLNRMGFNNKGLDHMLRRLARRRFGGVLGVSIGKNADTPEEDAVADYEHCMERVYGSASYVVANLSSPNTPGLRALQEEHRLPSLLERLKILQGRLSREHGYRPLLVKLSPDLDDDALGWVAAQLRRYEVDGVIAVNTHAVSPGDEHGSVPWAGGLSGAPLAKRAQEASGVLLEALEGALPLIASGGVMDAAAAAGRLEQGAALVQLYSGLIYRGVRLVREAATACAHHGGNSAAEAPQPPA